VLRLEVLARSSVMTAVGKAAVASACAAFNSARAFLNDSLVMEFSPSCRALMRASIVWMPEAIRSSAELPPSG
jgi:hypothetical protein